MKKNIIIIVLAALVVVFGLFGITQQIYANNQAEIAKEQRIRAEEQRVSTIACQVEAVRQRVGLAAYFERVGLFSK